MPFGKQTWNPRTTPVTYVETPIRRLFGMKGKATFYPDPPKKTPIMEEKKSKPRPPVNKNTWPHKDPGYKP